VERDYLWALAGLLTLIGDEGVQAFNAAYEREQSNPRLAYIRPCSMRWVDGERLDMELEVAYETEEVPADAHAN
jgi:hypothetical protein